MSINAYTFPPVGTGRIDPADWYPVLEHRDTALKAYMIVERISLYKNRVHRKMLELLELL